MQLAWSEDVAADALAAADDTIHSTNPRTIDTQFVSKSNGKYGTEACPQRSSSYIPPHLRRGGGAPQEYFEPNPNLYPEEQLARQSGSGGGGVGVGGQGRAAGSRGSYGGASGGRGQGRGRGRLGTAVSGSWAPSQGGVSSSSTRARSGPRSGGGGGGRDRGEVNPFGKEEVAADEKIFERENTGINFDAYEDIPVETSGENVPPPVATFADIDLGPALNDNIKRCRYVKPTPVQRHAIPISMAGRDLMACAQTGSGKTAAFCFPIIAGILACPPPSSRLPRGSRTAFPLALILAPTRELSMQV